MRKRRIIRLLFFILLVILIGPLLLPLPPVGVEAATLADPDGFFITVDDLSTYVLARGPQDGPPVLLLHGWGASTFTWRLNQDALAEAGYRAIAFDRPPYGLSAKTGANIPYSPAALADFTARVMDELGLESAVLVGQSQGGGVIGHFAVRYPQRVKALVFVSGALRPTDDPPSDGESGGRVTGAMGLPSFVGTLLDFPPFARWAQIGIRAFVKPDFAASILKSAYHDPAFMTPEAAEGYSRQLRVVGWDEALLNQLRGGVFQADPITAEQIASFAAPVMIAWGQDDTWVPVSVGERLHELLPGAVYVTYPNTGHLPQEEAADAFNADLLAFLRQAAPDGQ
jgi:pimeloyl-ACP methyl ester carboxylesterase